MGDGRPGASAPGWYAGRRWRRRRKARRTSQIHGTVEAPRPPSRRCPPIEEDGHERHDGHFGKPYCPEGDDAIRLEFKITQESEEVGIARTSHSYTGGMGIPKTVKLVSGDSLVYRVDFSSFWSLPFGLGTSAGRLGISHPQTDTVGPTPGASQANACTGDECVPKD